jgi:hypothetical protein
LDLTAATRIGAGGKVEDIAVEAASDPSGFRTFFTQTIEESIRSSTFLASCEGKTVRLSYTFRMNPTPPVATAWFGYPNRLEIWALSPRI